MSATSLNKMCRPKGPDADVELNRFEMRLGISMRYERVRYNVEPDLLLWPS